MYNLASTRDGLNLAAFEAMTTCLAQDKARVHVLAQINSAPVGSWLALHLNMCRPGVQELGAGAMDTTDQLLWVQPDDVLLVFSIRRYASGPAKVAQHFRDAGAQVLAITDSPAAPVATLAHHHLQVHTSNASPFDSYTAAFFLCNALVSAVAQLRHGAVPQVLARRDSLWDQFESQRLLDLPAVRGAGTRRKTADKK